ncbi:MULTISPECIES: NAD(P)-binding protein [Mammaliicoccus]|uniref:precorrin-2 dehydrogenase n=1 Tax=Mammaliicoccus lentus TaxID=42858 RepID=A0ABS6GVW2_MAMLE|nr:NAD(P)-binding protein [Mammaliicoccus lentus]MBF0840885.1 NAD(P)-binding protein [Mammaliicoccus lentus]MBU6113595.1 NAD(P)-binding protein [Mammaliicoccus lentus]
MAYVPILMNLSNKTVVIAGGGNIAERRVRKLINSGAKIHVISPDVSNYIYRMQSEQKIIWHKKAITSTDLTNADLVVVATDEADVNNRLKEEVPKHTLLNMTSNAQEGDVIFPGTFKRGKLTISVSSGGASPKLVSSILRNLEDDYPDDYGEYVDFLSNCRSIIKGLNIERLEQNQLLEIILSDKYFDKNKQREFIEWLTLQPKKTKERSNICEN